MNKALLCRMLSSLVLLLSVAETKGSCTTEEVTFHIAATSDVDWCPMAPWQTIVFGYNIFLMNFNKVKEGDGLMMTSINAADRHLDRKLRRRDRKLVKGEPDWFWGPRRVTAEIESCVDDEEEADTGRRNLSEISEAVFDAAVTQEITETLKNVNLCINNIVVTE